jgi:hypothetical protein
MRPIVAIVTVICGGPRDDLGRARARAGVDRRNLALDAPARGPAAPHDQEDRETAMLIVKKDGREIAAMVMSMPVDHCRGVVQCTLPGCEGWMPLVEPGTIRESGDLEDASTSDQVKWFLEHHECRSPKAPLSGNEN